MTGSGAVPVVVGGSNAAFSQKPKTAIDRYDHVAVGGHRILDPARYSTRGASLTVSRELMSNSNSRQLYEQLIEAD